MTIGWALLSLVLALGGCTVEPRGKRVGDSATAVGPGAGSTTGGFQVEDVQIDGAEDLTPNPVSEGLQLCALDGGQLAVAWADDRGGARAVWLTVSEDGGMTWPAAPVKVNDSAAVAENPSLGCGGTAIYVAWEDHRDSEIEKANIYFASSADLGQSWSASQRLGGTDDGVFALEEPTLAVDGNDVHVAWSSEENGAPDIYVASSTNGGSGFAAPLRVDGGLAGEGWSKHPAIAAFGGGKVLVAWEDRRSGTTDIYTAYSSDFGASFGSVNQVDSGSGNSFAPEIAAGGGEAYVAWHDDRDGAGLEIYAAHSANNGSSFSPNIRLSEGTPGERDSVLPQLALEGGVLHATWFQGMLGGYHIVTKRVQNGTELGPQTRVDHAPDAAQLLYPRMAVSGSSVVVVWRDDRDATVEERSDLYYAHSLDGGVTWSSEDLRVDSHDAGSTWTDELQLLLDDTGLSATWLDGRSGSSDVFFIHLALGDQSG